MRYVVALEQRGEDSTRAKCVWFEGDEKENRRSSGVCSFYEVLVQVRYEVSREVHGRGLYGVGTLGLRDLEMSRREDA